MGFRSRRANDGERYFGIGELHARKVVGIGMRGQKLFDIPRVAMLNRRVITLLAASKPGKEL